MNTKYYWNPTPEQRAEKDALAKELKQRREAHRDTNPAALKAMAAAQVAIQRARGGK